MKPWFTPTICTAIFAVLFGSVAGYYYVVHRQDELRAHEWSVGLLSWKNEDLDATNFERHYRENYPVYREDRFYGVVAEERSILRDKPDAKLFHYDAPKEVWQRLGGRKGYAILYDGRIIWEDVIAVS